MIEREFQVSSMLDLCDLMCGSPEDDGEEAEDGISNEDILGRQQGGSITGE